MKLKRHNDFIKESKSDKLNVIFMNNEDRKKLNRFLDILKGDDWDNLPKDAKMVDGEYSDAVASILYDGGGYEFKNILSKYYIDTEEAPKYFLREIISQHNLDWDNGKISSEDMVEDIKEDLIAWLIDVEIVDLYAKEVLLLTPEEEKCLVPKIGIDKYNL